MLLTSGQTFVHLTAAGRPEDTDYFYREIMVPHIRNSLHPPLNPNKLLRRKVCKAPSPVEALPQQQQQAAKAEKATGKEATVATAEAKAPKLVGAKSSV